MDSTPITVSDAIALFNQTMEYAFPVMLIEGEVSSFKVSQGKYVFFDIKDASGTLNCFMTVYQLRIPVEDGMRVQIVATPKLTQWGRFSLTVRDIQPKGEGSIKRAFELLQAKLEKEGLFDDSRKRRLPELPSRIGVISSTQAAGYIDFVTILNDRWGGMEVEVANVQVQGLVAPRQIVRAIEHFNQKVTPPEVIVIVRGGGSADDLSAFNDEPLVRAIAGSRVPTLVGVGHEVDVTLADLAADVRAATPSNAAQILVPDKRELIAALSHNVSRMTMLMEQRLHALQHTVALAQGIMIDLIEDRYNALYQQANHLSVVLKQLDPCLALRRGYALVRMKDGSLLKGDAIPNVGDDLTIQTESAIITAGVKEINGKKD